jgi:tetratricopeptide (TPR) repeat protein
MRERARAVQAARRAVELDPAQARYWLVLGISQFHCKNWNSAEEALVEFFERKEGPYTKTKARLYLSMAQWHLGKHAEAMETYQQAARVMESRFDVSSLFELQKRAADLLGVDVKK